LFDINLFTFPIMAPGTPLYPGFQVVLPTKKAARGRENDILILYFKLFGKSSITDTGLKSWLEGKAAAYHQSSGTVTSGIRSVFEAINQDLLERNSKYAKQNGQVSGSLKLMVLKKETVYFAVCGAGNGILAAKNDVIQAVDEENSGRGLGLTQSINVRFNQKTVENGDALVFVNETPDFWTREQFTGAASLTNEALYRRLFAPGIGEAQGVMIRFREGSGKVTLLKLRSAESGDSVAPSPSQLAGASTGNPVITASGAAPAIDKLKSEPPQYKSQVSPVVDNPVPDVAAKEPLVLRHNQPGMARTQPAQPENEINRTPIPSRDRGGSPQPNLNIPLPKEEDVKAAVGGALRKSAAMKNKTETWAKSALQKVIPGPADQPLKFPKALLVFIAVAVPVIVVVIIASIYIRGGRSSRFDGYLAEAMQLATRAGTQTESAARQSDLEQSLYWLDKADDYGSSDQSTQLRSTVQAQLDDIEGVTRIDMIAAINGSLPAGTVISQLAVSGTDLYALDSTTGTVLRFFQSGSEYQQDSAFDCGPTEKGSMSAIGKLVDMVPISNSNTYGASLLAIDAQGRLEYCLAGESGYVVGLAAPDMGWVGISSIAVNQGNLYVLDVRGNAVYKFEGTNYEFPDAPVLFFDDEIPSLTEAIDIEVVGYELYILRSNGEMVECTYSPLKDMKSTECKDPANFNDNRTGTNISSATITGSAFSQMHMTQAPDSSIYLLDNAGKAIYHLSYARNLQEVMYPRLSEGEDIKKYTPTGFTVSTNRQVCIAFGGLIYYGQMP
jgi:hypothetical protein